LFVVKKTGQCIEKLLCNTEDENFRLTQAYFPQAEDYAGSPMQLNECTRLNVAKKARSPISGPPSNTNARLPSAIN
jgi:hypothetical protein